MGDDRPKHDHTEQHGAKDLSARRQNHDGAGQLDRTDDEHQRALVAPRHEAIQHELSASDLRGACTQERQTDQHDRELSGCHLWPQPSPSGAKRSATRVPSPPRPSLQPYLQTAELSG